MNLRKIRSIIRLGKSLTVSFLYIPHVVMGEGNRLIMSDLAAMQNQIDLKIPKLLQLLFQLHNNRYFRNIFYHRLGPIKSALLQLYRPGDKYFCISVTTRIGHSMWIAHPYATIINADSIGSNFSCIHCTTIGATKKGRPVIGDNVKLGAHVTIIGNVHIGNNVTIGAGSVVVKDIPDNCVAVGNPAKVISIIR